MARDSCSLLGVSGGWPMVFLPLDECCGLCHSPLGKETNHPGQQSNDAYLITELNAFSKVDVKVKTCSSKDCLAIHQPFPVDIGIIFNTRIPVVSCENILPNSEVTGLVLKKGAIDSKKC